MKTRRPPAVVAEPLFVERRKAAGLHALERHAKAIRELRARAARDIVGIGERLAAARNICGHGDWKPWLDREFGWSESTALNFMRVAELSKAQRVTDLDLPLRSLYVVAAPSTPASLRREVLDRAEAGDPPSYEEIKEAVEVAKPEKQTKRALPTPAPAIDPPTPEEVLYRITDLFRQLDQQSQIDALIDLFKQLGPHDQSNAFLRLRQIATGRA
jgi:hypothetical protein